MKKVHSRAKRVLLTILILPFSGELIAQVTLTNSITLFGNYRFSLTDDNTASQYEKKARDAALYDTNMLQYLIWHIGKERPPIVVSRLEPFEFLLITPNHQKGIRLNVYSKNLTMPTRDSNRLQLKLFQPPEDSAYLVPLFVPSEKIPPSVKGPCILEARIKYWKLTNNLYTPFLSDPVRLPLMRGSPPISNMGIPYGSSNDN